MRIPKNKKEAEQCVADLELQINPLSMPPDYVDTSIGGDQRIEKEKERDKIKKEWKIGSHSHSHRN